MAAPTNMIGTSTAANEIISLNMAAAYALLLADRNPMIMSEAVTYVGDVYGSKSKAIGVALIGIQGYDLLATGTEGDPIGDTALSDSRVTVTVVQKSKAYESSDILRFIDGYNLWNFRGLVSDAIISGEVILRDMIANVINGFGTTVGTSGAAFTFSDFIDSVTTLNIAKVQGPFCAMLAPRQYGNLTKDAAISSGGALQYANMSQEMMATLVGIGAKPAVMGVDIITTSSVTTSGGNYQGAMWGKTGVFWADSSVTVENPIDQVTVGPKMLFERSRVAKGGTTAYVMSRYIGVSKGNDSAGVLIQSGTSA